MERTLQAAPAPAVAEGELVAQLLRLANPLGPAEPFEPSGPDEAARLLDAARAHRLDGLLLARWPFAATDPALRVARAELVGHAFGVCVRLVEVLDALERAGIEARPFKGPALSLLVYGDPLLRHCADIDLLVRGGDAVRARAALEAVGYRDRTASPGLDAFAAIAGKHFVVSREGDPIAVELHWTFSDAHQPFPLDAEDVWPRCVELSVLGRPIRTLAASDYLPVLCVHAYRHGWPVLEHLAQVAALVERHGAAWGPELWRRMARLRIRRVTAATLAAAASLFGSREAARLAALAPSDPVAEALAARLRGLLCRERPHDRSRWDALALARMSRERWSDRLRWFCAHPRLTCIAARRLLGWLALGWRAGPGGAA